MRVSTDSLPTDDDTSPKARVALASIAFFVTPFVVLTLFSGEDREAVDERPVIAGTDSAGLEPQEPEARTPEWSAPDGVRSEPVLTGVGGHDAVPPAAERHAALQLPAPGVVSEPADPQPQSRGLPRILSAADAKLYRQVFALQERGGFQAADRLLARIGDKLLMGHVLAQRHQRTARPRYGDLRTWLRTYRDHPDAGRIYRLARKVRPRSARRPPRPVVRSDGLAAEPPPSAPYSSRKNLTRKQRRRAMRIKRAMRIWLKRGYVTKTENRLNSKEVRRLFDRFEMDEGRARVAEAWFYQGRDRKAYKLSTRALARSAADLPLAHWTAGLSAWRLGKTQQAARHFESLAEVPEMSGWIGAGAALWAARANTKLKRAEQAKRWLEEAARYPYTLYGILALKALRRDLPLEIRYPTFSAAMADQLAATKQGRRALALIEVGENRRAEQELLNFGGWKRPAMSAALLALADHARLPSMGLKLTRRLAKARNDGRAGDPLYHSLYPIPPWRTERDSGIDQALLFAFMRQESDFNAFARSPVGARGLMQIMPSTAVMLNRGRRYKRSDRLHWYDPALNVELGQRYLNFLRRNKLVRSNLLRMIAGYNSGPGNIAYWARKKIKDGGDPLLFIEAMPSLETRLFVRRVLANLWIYRHRLGQPAPSLEAFASGRFPRYRPIDGREAPQFARNTPDEADD